MLLEEARWLACQLGMIDAGALTPLCNLGSASRDFRTRSQPYIDSEIFSPTRHRRIEVVHVDLKSEVGVDVAGDLTDPIFLAQLKARNFRCVTCCNLLEHVTDRRIICDAIISMLPAGAYIFVSVPNRFPYHADPIDTLFRPSVAELTKLFPGTAIVNAEIVRATAWASRNNLREFFWLGVRLCVPIYRPRRWLAAVSHLGDLLCGYRVTCAVLRKLPVSTS